MKKYKIEAYMNTLPIRTYRKAMNYIPIYLEISLNTFCNYKAIEIDDRQDIPHGKVVLLEKLFGFATGELSNVDFSEKPRTLPELFTEIEEKREKLKTQLKTNVVNSL